MAKEKWVSLFLFCTFPSSHFLSGAPHVHLLAWCKDRNGRPFPSIANCSEEEIPKITKEIEQIHSKIISCQLDEGEVDEDLEQKILKYQSHNCTFTCHKKKKTITIKKEEGYGISQVPSDATDLIAIPLCRFDFPKNPSDVTVCLTSFRKDEDPEVISRAKKDFQKIRKYLLRQTYCPNGAKREDQPGYKRLQQQTFKEFLEVVGMFEGLDSAVEGSMKQARARYHNALRVSIKGQASVFGERNTKSLFMNNFNKGGVAMTGTSKILALPEGGGGGLTHGKIFLVDLIRCTKAKII